METMKRSGQVLPIITQVENNTTLWIGHVQSDPVDHFAGQIFTCPSTGELDNIQVFSSAVQHPGELVLTLHQFDPERKSWGPELVMANRTVQSHDADKWIRFDMPRVPLQRNETYGFRLRTVDGMIAIGEAAADTRHPFSGQEWHGSSNNYNGYYYSYFSLAFKVEMCA